MAIFYIPVIKCADGEWTREMLLQEKDAKQSLLDDMWSGQVEDVSCIWRLNTAYGQMDDVTQEFADALGEMSIYKCDRPHRELRKWLDLRGVEYWQDDCDAFTGRRGFDTMTAGRERIERAMFHKAMATIAFAVACIPALDWVL